MPAAGSATTSYGANTDFAQVVAYYRTALKQRGELVFEIPQIHMFEVGRFREETMVFPPGVTVKDYSPEGYMSSKAKTPVRFQTIIQIVPGAAGDRPREIDLDRIEPRAGRTPLNALVSRANAQPRFTSRVVAAFGILALVLAGVRIYGTLSFIGALHNSACTALAAGV